MAGDLMCTPAPFLDHEVGSRSVWTLVSPEFVLSHYQPLAEREGFGTTPEVLYVGALDQQTVPALAGGEAA